MNDIELHVLQGCELQKTALSCTQSEQKPSVFSALSDRCRLCFVCLFMLWVVCSVMYKNIILKRV